MLTYDTLALVRWGRTSQRRAFVMLRRRSPQVNMAEFQAEHEEFSSELLTFALTYVLASRWPSNTMMADYNECDEVCEPGQEEPCGCTCNTDPFEWSDDEVGR